MTAHRTNPLTISLLEPRPDGYQAFDYLIDALPKTPPPPPGALEAFITIATLDEAVDLADIAYGWRLYDQTERAYQRALEHPKSEPRARAFEYLAVLIDQRHGSARALKFATAGVRERTERLGALHPDTLVTRNGRAGWLELAGDRAGALAEHLALLPLIEQAAGPHGWATLVTRRAIAHGYATGQWEKAARHYEQLAEDWSRVDGADNLWSISCRVGHAQALGQMRGPGEAIAALRCAACSTASTNTLTQKYASTPKTRSPGG
jgi:hypothetical protein